MKAPLKKLQGKYRYQVLMRVNDPNDEITDEAFSFVEKYNRGKVNDYMEINPNNLT